MSSNKIVNVQFASKHNPDEFVGRKYSYFTDIDLAVGDVVALPSKNGDGVGMVVDVDVPISSVSAGVLPLLKTIERKYEPEPKEQPQANDGADEVIEEISIDEI